MSAPRCSRFGDFNHIECCKRTKCWNYVAPPQNRPDGLRQIGWFYEGLSSDRKGFLGMRSTAEERHEFTKAEYAVYPAFVKVPHGVPVPDQQVHSTEDIDD
jgi:hypothetical protein